MPQFGVLVYLPKPADPAGYSAEYLEALERYPDDAKAIKAKVLGGTYFAGQKGFAFESSDSGAAVDDSTVREGAFIDSDLVPAAFFVLSAPDLDVAIQAARLHPAVSLGGVEVRPLVPSPA